MREGVADKVNLHEVKDRETNGTLTNHHTISPVAMKGRVCNGTIRVITFCATIVKHHLRVKE